MTQRSIRRLAARNGLNVRCNRSEGVWFTVDSVTDSLVAEYGSLQELQDSLSR